MKDSLKAIVEHALPWFDPAEARARDRRTEHIRQRSIAARLSAERLTPEAIERIRSAYRVYATMLACREARRDR